jgi:thiamine-monophosphate kinase
MPRLLKLRFLWQSNRFPLEALEELFDGIAHAAAEYSRCYWWRYHLISKGLIISITAIGEADEEEIVYRNGAKQTDFTCCYRYIGSLYGITS